MGEGFYVQGFQHCDSVKTEYRLRTQSHSLTETLLIWILYLQNYENFCKVLEDDVNEVFFSEEGCE